jgi:mono/diheme cytochrome c family protein
LKSSDGNFRPADLEFAPDGSLYVVDWQNVLIGHMQHNARDPHRDHEHGRIYRITYPSRPLVKPAKIAGAPLATLFENLKLPEYRTRYRTRREIRNHPADKVLPALQQWVAGLDSKDPRYEHHRLEALWTTWGLNRVDTKLLGELLQSPDYHARAAAVRVLRYNFRSFPDAAALLTKAAGDSDGRVRLEAVVAATWLDTGAARKVVETAAKLPQDKWLEKPTKVAGDRLAGRAEEKIDEHPAPAAPKHLTAADQKRFLAGHAIYSREGFCTTCHQADGNGLPSAGFPPLSGSFWATGSEERLIKVTLHGLMGPLELKGVKYPGQVPMTPFAGMLNDQEVADVLTFVRNSFGNQASPVSPETVAKVRKATGERSFYTPEELLKDHPQE